MSKLAICVRKWSFKKANKKSKSPSTEKRAFGRFSFEVSIIRLFLKGKRWLRHGGSRSIQGERLETDIWLLLLYYCSQVAPHTITLLREIPTVEFR